jgi:hypothetical protein
VTITGSRFVRRVLVESCDRAVAVTLQSAATTRELLKRMVNPPEK